MDYVELTVFITCITFDKTLTYSVSHDNCRIRRADNFFKWDYTFQQVNEESWLHSVKLTLGYPEAQHNSGTPQNSY
jgi:hypothetical protein